MARYDLTQFGEALLARFLDQAWPHAKSRGVEYADWQEIADMLFEVARQIKRVVEKTQVPWDPEDVSRIDIWLMELADSGDAEGRFTVPGGAEQELLRRLEYGIIGATLEAKAGSKRLNIPLPANAPDHVKGFAVKLYILGGPARDYPLDMFK